MSVSFNKITLLFVSIALILAAYSCADNSKINERDTKGLMAAEQAPADLYGGIAPERYLTGMFDPAVHPHFVCINDLGVPTDARRHYLRKSAATALVKMLEAFNADNPGIRIWVQSSTRTFDDQKRIWNNKFNGVVKVGGKNLRNSCPDEYTRALKILEFSSMPGTSRHHWGTDFDINVLTNSYYESGQGAVILEWLDTNASGFGFYRPYTAGRTQGYAQENWHWSYVPESVQFSRNWVELYNSGVICLSKKGLFAGSDVAAKLAPVYVQAVDPRCR